MDIIELLNKEAKLESEANKLKKQFPITDKNACLQCAAIQKEVKAIEEEICTRIKAIDADMSNDYSVVTHAFANSIDEATEQGVPVENVIFGESSLLDLRTASCMFRTILIDGVRTIVGGTITAQCKQFPWLLVSVSDAGVSGDPIWEFPLRTGRPNLSRAIGCGFVGGSYQQGMIAFFNREYARQMSRQQNSAACDKKSNRNEEV